MVWDLRGALLKKEEFDSARLAAFDFKHRVRSFRLLADAIGADADAVAARTVHLKDDELLAALADEHPDRADDLPSVFQRCAAEARQQLIAEIGDPTPTRLL